MRRSGATIASRSPARRAWVASMSPTVACRNGLPSPGGSIGHMLPQGFTARPRCGRWRQMKCQDVRRAFPLLIAGEIPLTEWALIETHLVRCAECRKELERQRTQAAERARARQRNATAAAVVATAVLLVVAGAGFYLYQGSVPDPYGTGPYQAPPRPADPPMTVAPVAPPVSPPVARPVPASAPVPVPVAPKPRPVVETAAPPPPVRPPAAAVSEVVPRPVRTPASAV